MVGGDRGGVMGAIASVIIKATSTTASIDEAKAEVADRKAQAKGTVKKTAISMVQYPEGVDFGAEKAQLVFGIAGIGDEHLDLLAKIAGCLEDPEVLEKMKTTDDADWIMKILS